MWNSLSINTDDPYEIGLAGRLQQSALAHVASSTAKAYAGAWSKFVRWCNSLQRPRRPLPADDITVGLYLQAVLDTATSYNAIKRSSAAIAFFQRVNLFDHLPTQSPEVCMVRRAAARKFGLAPKNRKKPFQWADILVFATAYCSRDPIPYCHLVVVIFCILSFGAMCRYSDLCGVMPRNISFGPNDSYTVIHFEKRKNDQFRKGSHVTVSAVPGPVCPVRLLRRVMAATARTADAFVFQNFDGRLTRSRPQDTRPLGTQLSYARYMTYLSSWFGSTLDLSPQAFRAQYGAQSGRSGGASAAASAGINRDLWAAHGSWHTWESQLRYMEFPSDMTLSVSRTIMGSGAPPVLRPSTPERADARTRTSAVPSTHPTNPPTEEEGPDVIPDVSGAPPGVFSWQQRTD